VQIAEAYLKRIAELDRKGPALRSVIETNPDALDDARQLDAERKSGKVRGPLHGIPVLLKDNIDTAGKMMTTAGRSRWRAHRRRPMPSSPRAFARPASHSCFEKL